MAHLTPELVTVTLLLADTNYTLSTLLAALSPAIEEVNYAQVGLQFDASAGADALLIGNPSVHILSSTVFGRRLLATQAVDFGPFESNLVRTDHIALRSNGAEHVVHVYLLRR